MSRNDETEARVLRRLVDRLPRTRDGARVIPLVDTVWSLCNLGKGTWQALDELAGSPARIMDCWSRKELAEDHARKEGLKLNVADEDERDGGVLDQGDALP